MIYGWLTVWLTDWIRVYMGNALTYWNTVWLTVFVWGLRRWLNDATLTLELIRLTGQCRTSMKTLHQYELNTIKIRLHAATTRHKDQISWPFLPFWKLAVVGRLFWQLGTCFSNRCRCGVVKTRVNTGTGKSPFVERWPLWRGGR